MTAASEEHPTPDASKEHARVGGVCWIKVRVRWLRLAIRWTGRRVGRALRGEGKRVQCLSRGQRIMILMTLVVGLWQGPAGFVASFVTAVTTYWLTTRRLI